MKPKPLVPHPGPTPPPTEAVESFTSPAGSRIGSGPRPTSGGRYLNSPPSPALQLARGCAAVLRQSEREETAALLALLAVAAVALGFAAVHLHRALIDWPAFVNLVQSVLS